MIQLITTKWPAMRYGTNNNHIIDFPGEYDVNGENIRCWEANRKLSFLVRSWKKSLAILSNKEVLDVWSYDDVDEFYCVDQSIIDEIERMDMGWETLILGESSNSSEEEQSSE